MTATKYFVGQKPESIGFIIIVDVLLSGVAAFRLGFEMRRVGRRSDNIVGASERGFLQGSCGSFLELLACLYGP